MSSNLFSFGSTNSMNVNNAEPKPFSFGTGAGATNLFGQPSAATSTTGGFTFQTLSSSATTLTNAAATPAASLFSFGQTPQAANALGIPPVGTATAPSTVGIAPVATLATPAPAFSFGPSSASLASSLKSSLPSTTPSFGFSIAPQVQPATSTVTVAKPALSFGITGGNTGVGKPQTTTASSLFSAPPQFQGTSTISMTPSVGSLTSSAAGKMGNSLFSFGSTNAANVNSAETKQFSFGTGAGSNNLLGPSNDATTTTGGLTFQTLSTSTANATATPAASLFSFGQTTQAANALGIAPVGTATTASSTGGIAPVATSTTPAPAFSLGTAPASLASSLASSIPSTTPSSLGFSIAPQVHPAPSTTTVATPALSFGITGGSSVVGKPQTTTASSLFSAPPQSQGTSTISMTPSVGSFTSSAVTSTSSATTGSVSTASSNLTDLQKSMTYEKLEQLVNSWTLEVEEQEQVFLVHAAEVNRVDRVIMANADKIVDLGEKVEQLEQQHARIDHDLEFVGEQQMELTRILDQLETNLNKSVQDQSQFMGLPAYHGAAEREQMVQQQINLDGQLVQIDKELEEVTEKIDAYSNSVSGDGNNMLKQIPLLLAKQMDALQWIGDQTKSLQGQLGTTKQNLNLTNVTRDKSFNSTANVSNLWR